MDGFSPIRPPRAGNRTRTGDPNLGKVVLYQLSYSRMDHGSLWKGTRLLSIRFLLALPDRKMKLEMRYEGVNPVEPAGRFP